MPEAESSGAVSDQESNAASETGGEMDIDHLWISSRSMSSLYLEVGGTVCPGFEIGWVSSIKVSLYHRHRQVGSMVITDTPLIPNAKNYVKVEWDDHEDHGIEIRDMVGFKSLFDDVMPKKSADYSFDDKKRMTAALRVSSNGHQLTMSIDLGNMPRMSTTIKSLKISRDKIEITMTITNPSPLSLGFDNICDFVLKKGQDTIGELTAPFDIAHGEVRCVFEGTISPRASGMVTLKGERYNHVKSFWQQYIMKLFEVEINLDEFIVKANGNGNGK